MTNVRLTCGLAAVLAIVALTIAADPPKPPKPPTAAPDVPPLRGDKLREFASKPIEIPKPFDGELRDLLEYLGDRYGVTFVYDLAGFRDHDPPMENIESTRVKLPKIPAMRFDQAMQLLLSQVGGTIIVRNEYVEITTTGAARQKLGYQSDRLAAEEASYLGQPVYLIVVDKTLTEALRELADTTGASIVIDGRAKEQAKMAVTASLQQVPLRTAVRVLADMTELKVVPIHNVLYVTTPENAEKLEKEGAAAPPPELAPAPTPLPPPPAAPPKKDSVPPEAKKVQSQTRRY